MPPVAEDFERALASVFQNAAANGLTSTVVRSGDLHELVGGYPRPYNRMPVCCTVMRKAMSNQDEIIQQPLNGNGANVFIKYYLPRG